MRPRTSLNYRTPYIIITLQWKDFIVINLGTKLKKIGHPGLFSIFSVFSIKQ